MIYRCFVFAAVKLEAAVVIRVFVISALQRLAAMLRNVFVKATTQLTTFVAAANITRVAISITAAFVIQAGMVGNVLARGAADGYAEAVLAALSN